MWSSHERMTSSLISSNLIPRFRVTKFRIVVMWDGTVNISRPNVCFACVDCTFHISKVTEVEKCSSVTSKRGSRTDKTSSGASQRSLTYSSPLRTTSHLESVAILKGLPRNYWLKIIPREREWMKTLLALVYPSSSKGPAAFLYFKAVIYEVRIPE